MPDHSSAMLLAKAFAGEALAEGQMTHCPFGLLLALFLKSVLPSWDGLFTTSEGPMPWYLEILAVAGFQCRVCLRYCYCSLDFSTAVSTGR